MQNQTRLAITVLFFALFAVSQSFGQRMMQTPEQRAQTLRDSLSLNDEQTAKVVKIYRDMDQQRKDMFQSGSSDRQERMQAMRDLMAKTDEKIEALLTDTQKTKFEELKKLRQQRMPGSRRRDRGN